MEFFYTGLTIGAVNHFGAVSAMRRSATHKITNLFKMSIAWGFLMYILGLGV